MEGKRIRREKKTIRAMVGIYCSENHNTPKGELCSECTEFLEYAYKRLDKCIYREGKPTCEKCPVHCYSPERREQAKSIMRYAGPRMPLHYPLMAMQHIIDGIKRVEKLHK